MKVMNVDELESNHFAKYQDIVLFMKNMGLIKDKSKKQQFHKYRKIRLNRIDTTSTRSWIARFQRDNKLCSLLCCFPKRIQ